MFRYDSYCGLYCGACDTLLANERGGVERLAREWGRTVAELTCHGCKTSVTAVFCSRCQLRSCAHGRGVEFCVECPDYPCPKLRAFQGDGRPHHAAVLANLERLRAVGREQWLAEQAAQWSCSGCGRRFSWYERRCAACGANLRSRGDEPGSGSGSGKKRAGPVPEDLSAPGAE